LRVQQVSAPLDIILSDMAYKHLTIEEREQIQRGLWDGKSIRQIAKEIGRPHSSVSREVQKNMSRELHVYTPRVAHVRALENRKNRGRKDRLKDDSVRLYVVSHLKERWSPEQISGRIKMDTGETISHEAIYQFIYAQVHRNGHGYIKPDCEDLRVYLRRRRKRRIHKDSRRCQRIFKPKGISIDERPPVVNERSRIGDWEGDSVESTDHKPGINTLVERKVGYVFITRLKDKTSASTVSAVVSRMNILPSKARKTLTLDNGPENSDYKSLENNTGLSVFYAHPYCSGERGTNENTNGLIRDYFPKKTDFSKVTDEEIEKVEYDLNMRPRKRLGFKTPLEALSGALRG